MPSTNIYLDGQLTMPNGAVLWAEDIDLMVDYERYSDGVDFDVTWVAPITAFDTDENEIRLDISPNHPAIARLVSNRSRDIAERCEDHHRMFGGPDPDAWRDDMISRELQNT